MGDSFPRILIVVDDMGHRQSLRLILEDEGFECREAENGEMAIGLLESHSHDIVLTDLEMTVMNGLQLVEWMFQGSLALKVPTIVVTGNLQEESKDRVLEAGASQIFTKPYNLEHLLIAIRSYLPNISPLHS